MLAKNTLEGKTKPFLDRIRNLLGDLESERGSYMAKCKTIREDIKIVYGEAKDAGIPVKALRGLVKYLELEEKQEAIGDALDNDEAKIFEHLREALGELGAAAADRAGHAPKSETGAEQHTH